MKMFKMMLVQLGVLLLAICISAQTSPAQNSTGTTMKISTNTNTNTTTMSTGTYSSSNSTNPTGAGVPLHTGTFSVLTPVIMAASLLQLYC